MFKTSARAVTAWGGLGRGECVGSIGLSPPRGGTCQRRCGAHHHVPRATSSCPHGARGAGTDSSAVAWPWGRGDRHHLGSGRLWWLCHHHVLGPCLPYFGFFAATGPAKLGYPPGCAPRDDGVGSGTPSEGVLPPGRSPSGEGTQPEMAARGGLRGHAPLPVLTHLQMLCGAPHHPRAVIAQLQRGSSITVCSKIANSLF